MTLEVHALGDRGRCVFPNASVCDYDFSVDSKKASLCFLATFWGCDRGDPAIFENEAIFSVQAPIGGGFSSNSSALS